MIGVVELEERYCAHNYDPLPIVLTRGKGVYVWDMEGRRYFDMMSAYSAVSHGHCHPRLVKVLEDQAKTLNIVSRAYHTDQLGPFVARACELTGMDMALPMNTGAEAVETALKAARKWAYTVKEVAENQAEIIVCEQNFHGRTISIVGFSSETDYRAGFGPFPPGFKRIPFGNAAALEAAISDNTAAFLVEPIQGEGGINVPSPGYLAECAEICERHNVLLLCDEIQTGLGRTGKWLASQHDNVRPDGVMLGKALGGGLLPVSLFLARRDIMNVFRPGDHGSTFGGNPLAARLGLEALNVLAEEHLIEATAEKGAYLLAGLHELRNPLIKDIRGKGLLTGIEIDDRRTSARTVCEHLLEQGVLSIDTHETVVRLAPPLVISKTQIDEVLERIDTVLHRMENQ